MSEFFKLLATQFPTLVVILAIMLVAWALVREYRKMKDEIGDEVDKAVSAKLGATLSGVKEIADSVSSKDMRISQLMAEVESRASSFSTEIASKETQIESAFARVLAQVGNLEVSIPDVEAESAAEILYRALTIPDPRLQAALCAKLLAHEDATASDLEKAGDFMRKAMRNSLSLKLYERAVELDPELISAQIELLAMKVETKFEERKIAIHQMRSIVLSSPTKDGIARVSNALMHVDKYEELNKFADELLAIVGENDELRIMALRNKAIALKNQGRISECKRIYARAFKINPNDLNTLKAYLSLLSSDKDANEYIDIATRLVDSDPTQVGYHIILLDHYVTVRNFVEARRVISALSKLKPDPSELQVISKLDRKLTALEEREQV